MHPYSIELNYENRHGERVTETTGYRELYEVLSYMVKMPYYCGEDHRARHDKMMAGDRTKLDPIYQDYLSKCDRRKNYLETQEEKWEKAVLAETDNVESRHEKINFHYDLWELPKGGAKTRYKWNVEAIRLLKQIESENKLATEEEQISR